MTNLQQSQQERDAALAPATLRRLWFWAPILTGGALALLVLSSLAVPQWLLIRRDQQRLDELEQRREQADLLRLQTQKVVEERQEALGQQTQLINLVAGKGDGATFLATLDLEARQTGVKLQLFEPTAATTATPGAEGSSGAARRRGSAGSADAAPPSAGRDGKAPPPPQDPLEQAGLKRRALLLTARGTHPQLLAFLRRIELLDLLVEQKDLSLVVAGVEAGRTRRDDKDVPPLVPEVEAKLALTLYNKPATPDEGPAPAKGDQTPKGEMAPKGDQTQEAKPAKPARQPS